MKTNYNEYAKKMLEIKGYNSPSSKYVQRAGAALRKAYSTVYKAVAFDIDGTLTDPDTTQINYQMANEIGTLLQRGVPVILISGRGRTSTKEAANQILQASNIEQRYAVRLQCITHNGIFWLKTPSNQPSRLFTEELRISPKFINREEIKRYILNDREIQKGISEGLLTISEEPTQEPNAIRITASAIGQAKDYIKTLQQKVKEIVERLGCEESIYITHGSFGNFFSIDISNTNKVKAIEFFSNKTGIKLEEILRIADSGDETGNDYELLNSSRAFSVDKVGNQIDKCFPIINNDNIIILKGVEATKILLTRVNIFPPLTLTPNSEHDQLKSLHQFEKIAITRSKREYDLLYSQIKLRLDRLLISDETRTNIQNIDVINIFENPNGGVKLRDWEVADLSQDHTLRKLFCLSDEVFFDFEKCNLDWALFTDDAILLRGPKYYWAMTNKTNEPGYFSSYVSDVLSFIYQAKASLQDLFCEEITFVKFKFVLGILDNVRNALIQIQNAIYISDILSNSKFEHTKKFFSVALVRHTAIHINMLLNANYHWKKFLTDYINLLGDIAKLIEKSNKYVSPYEVAYHKPLIRKWRECDDFLQNILAVEIGLHEFEGIVLKDENSLQNIFVIGLVYGGLELPVIAQCLSTSKNIPLTSGFLNLSLYSDQNIRKEILEGTKEISDIIPNDNAAIDTLVFFDGKKGKPDLHKGKTIIADDNCTTGRTIQLSRDILVRAGAEVIGAISVRYPGSNRYKQMQFKNHGMPDPEILLSFIRGLVSPSPYTRLLKVNNEENIYLDNTGVFDIARDQLERYLKKNNLK